MTRNASLALSKHAGDCVLIGFRLTMLALAPPSIACFIDVN